MKKTVVLDKSGCVSNKGEWKNNACEMSQVDAKKTFNKLKKGLGCSDELIVKNIKVKR